MERHISIVPSPILSFSVVSVHFLDRQPAIAVKERRVLHKARGLSQRPLTRLRALPGVQVCGSEDARSLWLLTSVGHSIRGFPVMSDVGVLLRDRRPSMEP